MRRYGGEVCADCGRPVRRCTGSWWSASDALWDLVVGDDSIVLCPPCFTARAEGRAFVHYRAVSQPPLPDDG